jgi:hypothetical protein
MIFKIRFKEVSVSVMDPVMDLMESDSASSADGDDYPDRVNGQPMAGMHTPPYRHATATQYHSRLATTARPERKHHFTSNHNNGSNSGGRSSDENMAVSTFMSVASAAGSLEEATSIFLTGTDGTGWSPSTAAAANTRLVHQDFFNEFDDDVDLNLL